jgi:uncharacterized protein Smg (DUF494 family)
MRNDVRVYTPAELAIRKAMLQVESMGAHKFLTDAIILLQQAREKIGEFVELDSASNSNRNEAIAD